MIHSVHTSFLGTWYGTKVIKVETAKQSMVRGVVFQNTVLFEVMSDSQCVTHWRCLSQTMSHHDLQAGGKDPFDKI